MPSVVAWLDASAAEQRRVREIVALFSQQESRDELGIGQIRDVLSDLLLPGTSVIQTRARYFLIVPWLFRQAEVKGIAPGETLAWVQRQERRLIETLRAAGALDGLIGRIAGPKVRLLPSGIYWSGLQRWGVLTRALSPDQAAQHRRAIDPDADELTERSTGAWHATLPAAPGGFPEECKGGLDLTHEEATWLVERILDRASNSLLADLVVQTTAPSADKDAPWDDDAVRHAAGPEARVILEHAERFSLAMHGPALLYNLLVAERYEKVGHTAVEHPVDWYREKLDEWTAHLRSKRKLLDGWDPHVLWDTVLAQNPRIGQRTRWFVELWVEVAASGDVARVADDTRLRDLVRDREHLQKGGQARLVNDRLLASWSGASGSGRLNFRWPVVRRIITDIHQGREAQDAGT